MKKILYAVLLLAFISGCGSKTPQTLEDHIKVANKSGAAVLIQIGNDTCGPCVEMKKILSRVVEDYQGKVKVLYIDTIRDPQLAKQYAVQKVPVQIFIDKNGKGFGRHEGYYSYEEIAFVLKDMGIKLF
ncbi:MAG: thioredoxin family protein [Nitrospiraceae bacterium]|nr:thioredoxin family protein [Nitrospiraceae bacterium]